MSLDGYLDGWMDNVLFKFISIELWVWCGVAEVYSMSCLLIQFLLTYSIQFVVIGSAVSDRQCE